MLEPSTVRLHADQEAFLVQTVPEAEGVDCLGKRSRNHVPQVNSASGRQFAIASLVMENTAEHFLGVLALQGVGLGFRV